MNKMRRRLDTMAHRMLLDAARSHSLKALAAGVAGGIVAVSLVLYAMGVWR